MLALRWSFLLILVLAPDVALARFNVTAVRVGPNLVITGDADPNGVSITQGNRSDVFAVAGLNGTTINGLAVTFFIGDVTGNIDVRLGGGDDELVVEDIAVPDSMEVKLDAGDDVVDYRGGSVADELEVNGNDGADDVSVQSVVADELTVFGDAGQDTVAIGSFSGRRLYVSAGRDDDLIYVDRAQTSGRASIHLVGPDRAELADSTLSSMYLSLGSDNNVVVLTRVSVDEDATAKGHKKGRHVVRDGGGNTFAQGLDVKNNVVIE